MKYEVIYTETWTDAFGDPVEEYEVSTSTKKNEWPIPHVWWNERNKQAHCCACSGLIAPMMSNCPHAQAVKRYKRKSKEQARLLTLLPENL